MIRIASYVAACIAAVAGLASSAANAAVPVTFAGGSGAPLTITLDQPYQFHTFAETNRHMFVVHGVGDFMNSFGMQLVGDITFSVNGGPARAITNFGTGSSGGGGDLGADDMYLNSADLYSEPGSIVVLSAGTLSTHFPIPETAPASGSFDLMIHNATGQMVSYGGVPVPEPASLGLAMVGAAAMLRRRRRRPTT